MQSGGHKVFTQCVGLKVFMRSGGREVFMGSGGREVFIGSGGCEVFMGNGGINQVPYFDKVVPRSSYYCSAVSSIDPKKFDLFYIISFSHFKFRKMNFCT